MITNEFFLEEGKKFLSQEMTRVSAENFINLVDKFQKERLERLAAISQPVSNAFSDYLPKGLNDVVEKQDDRQEKFFFESVAQSYTGSALVACKLKLEGTNSETEDFIVTTQKSVEKLLNSEKKNGHKFYDLLNTYMKTSQEYLYDYKHMAKKGAVVKTHQPKV